ncbi:MAG TPA: DNA polymerase III subunit gamma/tau [Actinomycetota bacterium]|nr:DNA polymerase III subunit gamma/tau [Actinomycetota bacterium]
MAYVSLYRKWRPQTFSDIVGQDHVVGTLVNAIRTGQVHHALLFTGTRGTGKTSTARILAKALNCERGPTAEPDNTCAQCVAITDGTSLDVIEIDAASHGSVDDARDLREKANYAPASARYKVYIVDEAHMVTTQGFNAMLKVLEEPPGHVRFIFATTEPHKVIEAIRSRCQQHDFRRVRAAVLVDHFAKVCAAQGVDVDQPALEMIARAADGSVRDGMGRLDQVLTYAGGRVRLADVAAVLGALPIELRFELAEALASHRVADVFACVERVSQGGHDLHQFAREALEHVRDLYVLRVAPESSGLVDVTAETRERLAAQAERFGPGELGRLVRILGDLYLDLRTATDQRLVLEIGLARAALPEASLDADALLARIERLERRLSIAADPAAPGSPPGPPAPASTAPRSAPAGQAAPASPDRATPGGPAAVPPGGAQVPPAQVPPTPPTPPTPPAQGPAAEGGGRKAGRAGRAAASKARQAPPDPAVDGDWAPAREAPSVPVDLDLVLRSWSLVVDRVRAASRVAATYLENGRPVAVEGRQVVVEFPPESRFYADALSRDGRSKRVDAALENVLGGDLEVRIRLGEAAGALAPAVAPDVDEPAPAPPGEPAPAVHATEFEVDPANDEGEQLDSDADARAVADWAARELAGEVIEERPNEAAGRGAGESRTKERAAGGRRSSGPPRERGRR